MASWAYFMYGDKAYVFFGAVWGITSSFDVSKELTSIDEEVGLVAVGVISILALAAPEPVLGVGIGEVGGFKSA